MSESEFLTARQLADALGPAFPDERSIYRLNPAGIPRVVLNRRTLYSLKAVETWLAAHRTGDWQAAPATRDHLRRVS